MRQKATADTEQRPQATRLAWWAAFFVTIVLVLILGQVRSAQAAPFPAGGAPMTALAEASEEEFEEDEGEGEEPEPEGCEVEDEESGECTVAAGQLEAVASGECTLRSTTATVSVLPSLDRVRLALHYTTFSAGLVSIEYLLRGNRGGLNMGRDTTRFSLQGTFRDTETLSESEMARAKAATAFEVRIHAANTPRYCHRFFDRALSTRHAAHGELTWTARPTRSAPR